MVKKVITNDDYLTQGGIKMKKFHGTVHVGLREKDTHRLIAIYPEPISGDDREIEDKVRFWYYQQSCGAEDQLNDCVVDEVSEDELKAGS